MSDLSVMKARERELKNILFDNHNDTNLDLYNINYSELQPHVFQSNSSFASYVESFQPNSSYATEIDEWSQLFQMMISWQDMLLVAVFCAFIVITIIGNTLVIMAVITTRRLKTVTNCFVMSLAVADLLVGIFVMPPAVAVHLKVPTSNQLEMLATRNKNDESATYQTWEDKEIKFDIPNLQNRYRNGEMVLATINHIEDSKGNPGDTGSMLATNLRIIWHSLVHKKFNLSIGYGRIITLNTRTVFSKVRGTTQALYVLAAGEASRFEFLFTDVSGETKQNAIFSCIYDIHHIYQKTLLYRELKLRSAILHSGQLILLPQEQIYSTLCGIWNLSSDQGNLGSFIVTNIRLVWFADINENFNISLPYMQISNIKIRESKYGDALVVQTSDAGGGYVLGFRIDPPERLQEVYKELTSLFAVYSETPNFGVHYIYDGKGNSTTSPNNNEFKIDEFQEIDEVQEKEINSKLTAYIAEGYATHVPSRQPVYCKDLGFAMEQIRDGYKLSDLWEIVNTQSGMIEHT